MDSMVILIKLCSKKSEEIEDLGIAVAKNLIKTDLIRR